MKMIAWVFLPYLCLCACAPLEDFQSRQLEVFPSRPSPSPTFTGPAVPGATTSSVSPPVIQSTSSSVSSSQTLAPTSSSTLEMTSAEAATSGPTTAATMMGSTMSESSVRPTSPASTEGLGFWTFVNLMNKPGHLASKLAHHGHKGSLGGLQGQGQVAALTWTPVAPLAWPAPAVQQQSMQIQQTLPTNWIQAVPIPINLVSTQSVSAPVSPTPNPTPTPAPAPAPSSPAGYNVYLVPVPATDHRFPSKGHFASKHHLHEALYLGMLPASGLQAILNQTGPIRPSTANFPLHHPTRPAAFKKPHHRDHLRGGLAPLERTESVSGSIACDDDFSTFTDPTEQFASLFRIPESFF